MWEAINEQAKAARLARPTCTLVIHADGSAVTYTPTEEPEGFELGDTPGEFPAAVGWSCRDVRIAWNGAVHEVTGLRRKFLRALIHRRGDVIPDRTLKLWVWNDSRVSDSRVKDVACQVRGFVRIVAGLPEAADPVERVGGGYRLAIF